MKRTVKPIPVTNFASFNADLERPPISAGSLKDSVPESAWTNTGPVPPRSYEYAYYAVLAYAILGDVLGISVQFFGAGALVVLAVLCYRRLSNYRVLLLRFCFALSFVAIQVMIHDESISGSSVRSNVTWFLGIVVAQSLCARQRFLHRFACAALLIGLSSLPFLEVTAEYGEVTRIGLEKGSGLSNPNALAEWFGYCGVYFFVLGLETRNTGLRFGSWLATTGCLYIIGLTVSRAALLTFAIASAISLRRLLKRGFIPILLLCILVWALYVSGLFSRSAAGFEARATEETGRFILWPAGFARWLESPFFGVGVSDVLIAVPGHRPNLPHNTLLYLALSSGVVPLILFVAYWIPATKGLPVRSPAAAPKLNLPSSVVLLCVLVNSP